MTEGAAKKLYNEYGNKLEEVIAQNPYILIGTVDGFAFKKVDALALANGFPRNGYSRLSAAAKYVIDSAQELGNCFEDRDSFVALYRKLIPIEDCDDDTFAMVLDNLVSNKQIIYDNGCYYSTKMYWAEETLAKNIVALTKQRAKKIPQNIIDDVIAQTEKQKSFEFELPQKEAVVTSLNSSISVITGGPGTGKTTILQVIANVWHNCYGNQKNSNVILCAPTGKAAKRMEESTGREAGTIHSILLQQSAAVSRDTLFIVDESSMIDIVLACRLVEYVKNGGCTLIFVGDADQLPPVGPGKFFKDLIASGVVPVTRLALCHRQTGTIKTNAYKIKEGCAFRALDFSDESMTFEQISDVDALTKRVVEIYTDLLKNGVAERDIGVVVPLRKEKQGCITVSGLNKALKSAVNPSDSENFACYAGVTRYDIGDRVMNTKNIASVAVYNGDIGEIIGYNDEYEMALVAFDSGIDLWITKEQLDYFVHAYAITAHKSQGSEYQNVIVVHTMHEYYMLERNLTYTAVTRAKEKVFLLGEAKAYSYAVKNNPASKRKTNLVEFLHDPKRKFQPYSAKDIVFSDDILGTPATIAKIKQTKGKTNRKQATTQCEFPF